MKCPLRKWIQQGLLTRLVTTLTLTLFSTLIHAGGFQLSDHSVTAMGRAQAGYGIMGDDASAGHFNPAGSILLNKKQLQLSVITHRSYWRFSDTGSTNANTGNEHSGFKITSIPNNHFVIPVNERLVFSWAATAPFGSNVEYNDDFFGRFSALKTRIKSFNLNPSFGYKLNKTIALGAGIFLQKFETTLQSALLPSSPGSTLTIDGDSTAVGYNLGIMINTDEDTRWGLGYRSKTTHDLEGSATFSGLAGGLTGANGIFPATSTLTLPESAYLAYTTPITDKWQFSVGYRWTRWSRFQEMEILYPTGILAQRTVITSNWKDISTLAIGFDRTLDSRWSFRMGFAYDQSPVPFSTRTARNIETDRIWYSIGATYAASKQSRWDFAYRYIDSIDEEVNQDVTRSGTSIGNLDASLNGVNFHSLAIQYKRFF